MLPFKPIYSQLLNQRPTKPRFAIPKILFCILYNGYLLVLQNDMMFFIILLIAGCNNGPAYTDACDCVEESVFRVCSRRHQQKGKQWLVFVRYIGTTIIFRFVWYCAWNHFCLLFFISCCSGYFLFEPFFFFLDGFDYWLL